MRTAAILLAAGEGRRLGGPKGTLTLGGESFLSRSARALDRPGVALLLIVIGCQAERLRELPGVPERARFLLHPGWAQGMLSSLLCGLDEAESLGAQALLVHPVDHPVVSAATVDAVLRGLEAGGTIVVPSHERRRGHPAGFSAAAFSALRAADAAKGARDLLERLPHLVRYVEADATCVTGVNTPEDYAALTQRF